MPALTSYSSYETLVFFQNVVCHGADPPALQHISATLNQNQLIRECEGYDPTKFTPEALLYLYDRVISVRDNAQARHVNGDTPNGDVNPRKRKISPVPAPNRDRTARDDQGFLQSFVDNLYASFRKETVGEIRKGEEQYHQVQQDIANLEERIEDEQKQPANGTAETSTPDPSPSVVTEQPPATAVSDQSLPTSQAGPDATKSDAPSPVPQSQARTSPQSTHLAVPPSVPSPARAARATTPRSGAGTPHPPPVSQLPPQQSAQPSPSSFQRNPSAPSPSRGAQPLAQTQHGYPPSQHQPQPQPYPPHMLPPHQAMQQVPSQGEYSSRASSQGRGSPLPYQPHPHYPPHQPYPNTPVQWAPVPSQPYPAPYGPTPYYPPQVQNRQHPQMQTPHQQPYIPYPQTAPMPYPPPQWRGPPPVPYQSHPASASTTPVPRPRSKTPLARSANSTPWKQKSVPAGTRVRSPSRNERDVSPLSDRASPVPPAKVEEGSQSLDQSPASRSIRQDKEEVKPSAPRSAKSRSHSVASNSSEPRHDNVSRKGRSTRIKAEPPSTPGPPPSDTEQKSSGRRVRPRGNTTTTRPDISRNATSNKRKRDSVVSRSPTPTAAASSPTARWRGSVSQVDPNLIGVSRNFAKTCQMLLNEITSHKLAGIFAKPLTERDAPGYRSLVRVPQDLKSIKTAISKGSRAANTAIEDLESKETDENEVVTTGNTEGPMGNGFYLVQKNEDLLPPKGIVNSSQLETELVRMFANAIMFNPLNSHERGFGRSLRLRRHGGQANATHRARRALTDESNPEEATDASTVSATDSTATPLDEGGIITDAREFFNDVTEIVAKWRELEEERMGAPNATASQPAETTRHASVSASSVNENHDEDGGGASEATATANAGTARKRRKVGEHI